MLPDISIRAIERREILNAVGNSAAGAASESLLPLGKGPEMSMQGPGPALTGEDENPGESGTGLNESHRGTF